MIGELGPSHRTESEPVAAETNVSDERLRKDDQKQDTEECEMCSAVVTSRRKEDDGIGIPGSNVVLIGCTRCGHRNVKRRVSQGMMISRLFPGI